ncbi:MULTISPECIES: type II secretion system protein GspD [unclassified Roseateles]|uniref:type II secretion system protein GspD n=1 Tax=unclassified Roseateles TaxID=2626991 RepID=UPI0006F5BEF9|nr:MULTISPECIES: secretin N-terminal domain-containing protein [unclassified Roseateles]KQW42095.1 hypothetical protein ASC81_22605 [Pelomonas sp. Root405]KRA67698.1 hypothetical protein ASD88_24190 [Pelomonas sp. Root662]
MTKPAPSTPHLLPRRLIATAAAASVATLLAGCQHLTSPILPDRRAESAEPLPIRGAPAGAPASAAGAEQAGNVRLFQTPAAQPGGRSATRANPARSNPAEPDIEASVALEQLPLPVFIDTVYATILKRNVSVDPAIATRKELVSLKSGKTLSATALAEAARAVLKSYGIAVTEFDNLVRVTPAGGNAGYLPELQRGRASADVPQSLRPVFYMAELESVSPSNVSSWLKTLFGQRVNVQDDLARQAVLLSGQTDDVNAALEAIQVLDQPLMRGRTSARIAPLYWSADELSKKLTDVLQAQGYSVGNSGTAQAPVILLPIGPLNSVIVYATSDNVLNHVLRWATELDQPASGRGSAGYFTYPVRNMDAGELAKTLQEVMNPAAAPGPNSTAVKSRVVVNAASNTLIIQGSPTEYQQWFGLLQELDRPARTALVSVTVAEVALDDTETLGFKWILDQFRIGGFNVNLSSLTSTGSSAGMVAQITSRTSSTNALLNALAVASKARILANPSILARNGETASIQVGQDVPIITQQQQATNGSGVPGGGSSANVLQTIQYRNAGVILNVKPVIHAGGRIDLDVSQEVSAVVATDLGVQTTPTFSSRKLTTKLSVADGTTVLLGGLMRMDNTVSNSGIPMLKDIPVVGHLFKSSTDKRVRTELVVLVTPYVINDEFEARAITDAFRRQFSWDNSTPLQQLRPPLVDPVTRPPAAIRPGDANVGKPYELPPVEAEKPSRPSAAASGVGTQQQSAQDFPLGTATRPAGVLDSSANVRSQAGAPATPASDPQPRRAGDKPNSGAGKPVEDPQLLKELMDAVNRKR